MHRPRATYRIQLNHEFGFNALKAIVPYLASLGISEVYASPIFKARKNSLHGYDIVDPTCLNPELGTREEFDAMMDVVKAHHMTWMQDIVPNHMALDSDNLMLMDIFENGKDSNFFNFFDIDWNHPYENMRGRMLVPILGKFYAQALEGGEILLSYGEEGFKINYYGYHFPLNVDSYAIVLHHDMEKLEQELVHNPDLIQLLGIINLFKALANQIGDIAQSEQMRHAKSMLWHLYNNNSCVKDFIDKNLNFFNCKSKEGSSFDHLDHLISKQLFRLSFWKVATEEINYRRFFTISDLISVRVEDENIFQETHKLIFELLKLGKIQSIRVDHIDGLYDPEQYLKRLRIHMADQYLVVEKILFPNEQMLSSWPIQGSTGYDYMNYVNGVFCVTDNKKSFERIYHSFAHVGEGYENLVCEKKRVIISKHLAGNIDNLAHHIKHISSHDRSGRDITLYGLRRALVEVMAHFPVYRTYINGEVIDATDRLFIDVAIKKAKKKLPEFYFELDFIKKFLLLQYGPNVTQSDKASWINFVMHFQQLTGPVMAKGFEDTMLYVYNPLISLNEVGGSPQKFGFTSEEFHAFNAKKFTAMPHSMNATATHDTKRGEDTRARINVLSEIPQEWDACITAWRSINQDKKLTVDDALAPDSNDEYFLYQTLLGSMPFDEKVDQFKDRVKEYFIKAIRESKRHTQWIKPAEDYENACMHFVDQILDKSQSNSFLESFIPFQKKIAAYGVINSLAQTTLKMTSPGIPDFYQGCEFWDLSMVDPDNRRAVDYDKRYQTLQAMINGGDQRIADDINYMLSHRSDPRIKLFIIHQLLKAMQKYENLFQRGNYTDLTVSGKFENHVLAFVRQYEQKTMIVIVPRFCTALVPSTQWPLSHDVWGDTFLSIPTGVVGDYVNVVTNNDLKVSASCRMGDVLTTFPVAVLITKDQKGH